MLDTKVDTRKKIADFKCDKASASGFSDKMIDDLKLEFPQTYNDPVMMTKTAAAMKEAASSQICIIPFCHTVEAEALGGSINLNDGKFGPRAANYAYQSVDDLLHLPDFDFEQGRISKVLEACRILKSQEERVVLEVSGYFTILNSLIDISQIFKALRKNDEQIAEVFNILTNNLLGYIKEAKNAGVDVISYADPAGGAAIVGPKFTEMTAQKFTAPLLKKAADLADENCIIHLCPKTSLILLSLGLVEKRTLLFDRQIHYAEACLKAIGQEKLIGQACIKDSQYILNHGKMQALRFL